MEYTIVDGPMTSRDGIVHRVNRHIADGWIPQGGICYYGQDSSGMDFFVQAMVKHPKDKSPKFYCLPEYASVARKLMEQISEPPKQEGE